MTVEHSSNSLLGVGPLFAGTTTLGQSERVLLERFVSARDELAFEAIVARHGPMVAGVCRSVLANSPDVDDAFQATFLVLARKAGSLRDGDQLSPWLHGVARRVALRARANSAKRRGRETPSSVAVATAPDRSSQTPEDRELATLLHAELDRLPLAERSALLLCDLEGLSHQEAADQLGWPLGTVKSRVNRGRERLRSRLLRRGVTLSASAVATALGKEAVAQAAVARLLIAATTRASLAIAAGRAVTIRLVSTPVFTLTEGAIRAMIITKFKVFALGLAATMTVLAVPAVVAYQTQRSKTQTAPTVANPSEDLGPTNAIPIVNSNVESDSPDTKKNVATSPEIPAKDLAILKKLEEPNPLKKVLGRFFGGSPTANLQVPLFPDLMEFVSEATIDPAAGLPSGIPIKFTNLGKRLATTNFGTVAGLVAGDDVTPLRVVLSSEAARHGLEYRVAGGVLTFDESLVGGVSRGVEKAEVRQRMQNDDQRNEMIRAKLDRVIPLKFPNKVSLNELVAYIKKATRDGDEKPIPIYVDPRVFGEQPIYGDQPVSVAKKTADDPAFVIDLDDVPLRTSLRLALIQMRLEYAVSGGLLMIGGKAPENFGGGGGGFQGNGSRGIYDLVEPRDRTMGSMGGGFR